MNRLLRSLLLMGILTFPLHGTAQMGEVLEYKGKTALLFSTPLEEYFSEKNPRPNDILRGTSTANWRGYIGHWKIDQEHLWLTKLVRPTYEDGVEDEVIPIEKILGKGMSLPIKAEWFSGVLRIPGGEQVRYVHMGFGSRYERETMVHIEKGKVVKETTVHYDPERDAYRSQSDMSWVSLAQEEVKSDPDSWHDARFMRTPYMQRFMEGKIAFNTRGILFMEAKEPSRLFIPDTEKTPREMLPLHKIVEHQIPNGSHVEVECRFYEKDKSFALEVLKIRHLKPGESIHHPKFPATWKDLMKWIKEQEKQGEAEKPLKE